MAHEGLASHNSSIEPTMFKNSSVISPLQSHDELAARVHQESQQTIFQSRSPSFTQVPMIAARSVLGMKPSAPSQLNMNASIEDYEKELRLVQVTQTPMNGSPVGEISPSAQ